MKFKVHAEAYTLPPPLKPGQTLYLVGRASAPAIDAAPEVPPEPASPEDIQGIFILTDIDVAFYPKATVGQVNAAIRAVHGSIGSHERGVWSLTLHVPRAGSVRELDELAKKVASMPGILSATPGRLTSTK